MRQSGPKRKATPISRGRQTRLGIHLEERREAEVRLALKYYIGRIPQSGDLLSRPTARLYQGRGRNPPLCDRRHTNGPQIVATCGPGGAK
jgi:hypothetical protein